MAMARAAVRGSRRSPILLLLGLAIAALAALNGFTFVAVARAAGSSAGEDLGFAGSSQPLAGSVSRASKTARAALSIDEEDLVQPDVEPERSSYLLGFTFFAETLNGRIAMIAFFVLIFLEFFTNSTFFQIFGGLFGGTPGADNVPNTIAPSVDALI
mmetsp:Transcript_104846/g.306207  ORF Transcript_104846/g.306207 Transcript_104846/m.306207 type:complete len:157 (+) Transcript_104846:95-565(+)